MSFMLLGPLLLLNILHTGKISAEYYLKYYFYGNAFNIRRVKKKFNMLKYM